MDTYTGLCLFRKGISAGSFPLSKCIQACCKSIVYILQGSRRNTWSESITRKVIINTDLTTNYNQTGRIKKFSPFFYLLTSILAKKDISKKDQYNSSEDDSMGNLKKVFLQPNHLTV